MNVRRLTALLACFLIGGTGNAATATLGHYAPGVMNIRDFVMPDRGFYFVQYHYLYSTDTLRDRNGDKVRSLSYTGPLGGTTTLIVDPDVDVTAIIPTFIWTSDYKLFGGRYGAVIAPSFSDGNIAASLELAHNGRFGVGGRGTDLDIDTGLGVGDLLIQPLWLDWSGKHYDLTATYGFYAPVGDDDISLHFWTNQFQLTGTWYPFDNKGTAVNLAGTYELQSEKSKDQVHAAGIQTSLLMAPWKAALTFRYQWEFDAEAPFRRHQSRRNPGQGLLTRTATMRVQKRLTGEDT